MPDSTDPLRQQLERLASDPLRQRLKRIAADSQELGAAMLELDALAGRVGPDDPAWPLAQMALRVTLMFRRSALGLEESVDLAKAVLDLAGGGRVDHPYMPDSLGPGCVCGRSRELHEDWGGASMKGHV